MASKPHHRLLLAILLASLATGCGKPAAKTIELTLGDRRIQVEIAATPEMRSHGLMGRQSLPTDSGMLFVFPERSRQCMWMKDTVIPLSVAFLDEQGRILDIAEMAPESRQLHCSSGPARYALEMNAGWFGKNGGGAGQRITGLGQAPRPE